jgi:hypothetical protein
MEESSKIYYIQLIVFGILAVVNLIVVLTLGFKLNKMSIVNSTLLCLSFPFICTYLNFKINNFVIGAGKAQISKTSTMW